MSAEAGESFYNHKCSRPCNGVPMICQYTVEIESYSTMSKACLNFPETASTPLTDKPEDCVLADGVPRLIYAVNRQLPSPQIRVSCFSVISSP